MDFGTQFLWFNTVLIYEVQPPVPKAESRLPSFKNFHVHIALHVPVQPGSLESLHPDTSISVPMHFIVSAQSFPLPPA
jgi:hypothetical protein